MPLILIVDDDRLTLATIAGGLRDAGYEAREASSGEEGLRLCEERQPDLAILDVAIPGMSGIDVAGKLSSLGIPFIFLSSFGNGEVVKAAVEAGAISYLVKPINMLQIIPVIEAALVRAVEIKTLKKREGNLNAALASGRETSIAIGLLMERFCLKEADAFEVLRNSARSGRRKVTDVARELVQATNTLNQAAAAETGAGNKPGKKKR